MSEGQADRVAAAPASDPASSEVVAMGAARTTVQQDAFSADEAQPSQGFFSVSSQQLRSGRGSEKAKTCCAGASAATKTIARSSFTNPTFANLRAKILPVKVGRPTPGQGGCFA